MGYPLPGNTPEGSTLFSCCWTRLPGRTLARSLARNARQLLTPPTLRSARTSSPPTARRPPSRSTTPLRLLDMTPRLCLMVTVVMEDMATEVQTYEYSLLIIGI